MFSKRNRRDKEKNHRGEYERIEEGKRGEEREIVEEGGKNKWRKKYRIVEAANIGKKEKSEGEAKPGENRRKKEMIRRNGEDRGNSKNAREDKQK